MSRRGRSLYPGVTGVGMVVRNLRGRDSPRSGMGGQTWGGILPVGCISSGCGILGYADGISGHPSA